MALAVRHFFKTLGYALVLFVTVTLPLSIAATVAVDGFGTGAPNATLGALFTALLSPSLALMGGYLIRHWSLSELGWRLQFYFNLTFLTLLPILIICLSTTFANLAPLLTLALSITALYALLSQQGQSLLPGIHRARFAAENDLAPLHTDLTDPDSGNAVLVGLSDQGVLGVKPGHEGRWELGNFGFFGRTRSGKGRSIAMNLYTWRNSVIVTDIKGENYATTAGYRTHLGEVYALNPEGVGHRYDPIAELYHSEEALRTAASILVYDKDDQEKIFAEKAAQGVYAALLAARLEHVPALPYLEAVTGEGLDGFVQRLTSYDDPRVTKELVRFIGMRPEHFSLREVSRFTESCWGTLTTRLTPLFTGGILRMTSGSDFRASDLYQSPTSLYLVFSESEARSTGKAFTLTMFSLFTGLFRAYDKGLVPLNHPVLALLDEAANTPLPDLSRWVSTAAGRAVSVALYYQGVSQLREIYGEAGSDSILQNLQTKVFHPTDDRRTAEYLSTMAGQFEYEERGYAHTTDLHEFEGSETWSVRPQKAELLPVSAVRTLHPDQVIILSGTMPPIVATRAEPNYLPHIMPSQGRALAAPPLLPTPEVNLELRQLPAEGVSPPAFEDEEEWLGRLGEGDSS